MQKTIERFVTFGRAALAKLKRRNWYVYAVVAVALFIATEIALSLIPGVTTSLLSTAWIAIKWLGSRPMWFGGTILLGWAILLLGVSWWETSPVVERLQQKKKASSSSATDYTPIERLHDGIKELRTSNEKEARLFNELDKVRQREISGLEKQVLEKDREIKSHEMILRQHEAEFENFRRELRQWQEFVWYGEQLANFRHLSESDYSVMVSRIGELREHVRVLLATSYALWAKVTGWTELRADYESPSYWPARLINDFVFRAFENAVRDFEQLLENEPQKDPRPYILLVYKKHGKIELWVTHLLKASKKHPDVRPRFADPSLPI